MKKISLFLVVMLIVGLLAGCQPTDSAANNGEIEEIASDAYDFQALAKEVEVGDNEVTFIDYAGDTVSVTKNPQRVIGLVNSFVELWYLSGGEIIGRIDSTTNLPEEAVDAEIVGTMTELNVEKIIELQPDLVILRTSKQQDIVNILKENNIEYISTEYDSFEDYLKLVKIFSELNGKPELYDTLGLEVKKNIDEIIAKVPEGAEPTALLMFATTSSVKAYLSNTANGQMLEQLGVKNIGEGFGEAASGATSLEFSMEKLLEIDPDFIFVQSMGNIDKVKEYMTAQIESNPAWSSLSAVKNEKYIFLDTSLFHYKPNDEYARAYEELAKILYPELFK